LNGLEKAAFSNFEKQILINFPPKKKKVEMDDKILIRYNHSFVVVTNIPKFAHLIRNDVSNFLKIRYSKIDFHECSTINFVSTRKEKIHTYPKLEFLGFTFMFVPNLKISRVISKIRRRLDGNQLLTYPSKVNVLTVKKKLGDIINKSYNSPAIELVSRINPIITG